MCLGCISTFMNDPLNILIIGLSLLLGGGLLYFFIRMRKNISTKKKIALLYGTAFFFIFPIPFYIYNKTCGSLYSCNIMQSIILSAVVSIIVSVVLSFIIVPLIYSFSTRSLRVERENKIYKMTKEFAQKLNIKAPRIRILDSAEPKAFSFTHILPQIFLSVGLLELLNQNEVRAVLLHELGHIKQGSSIIKFTNSFFRFFFPITNFNVLHNELNEEEQKADEVAISIQGTHLYLLSAKQKIRFFFSEKNELIKEEG